MVRTSKLSTTAHAVLALLGLRSFTGYQLTQQARRSLHLLWPKAESLLYAQPPMLVDRGLATVDVEADGARSRKRYTITDDGRATLAEWFASEPAPPHLEIESILRFAFSDLGTVADAQASIGWLRDWAVRSMRQGLDIAETFEADDGPFPERSHLNALVGTFYESLYEAILDWCQLATDEVHRWDATDAPGTEALSTDILAASIARANAALDRHEPRHC